MVTATEHMEPCVGVAAERARRSSRVTVRGGEGAFGTVDIPVIGELGQAGSQRVRSLDRIVPKTRT